jgi:tetratricopeptide (TPR) repeat protein
MTAERLNLHAAVGAAASRTASLMRARSSAATHGFLRTGGYLDQANTPFGIVINAGEACGDRLRSADALTDLGDIQRIVGDYEAATENLAGALMVYRADGRTLPEEANTLVNLGGAQYAIAELPEAAESLTAALTLFHDHGDRLGEVTALDYLGTLQ